MSGKDPSPRSPQRSGEDGKSNPTATRLTSVRPDADRRGMERASGARKPGQAGGNDENAGWGILSALIAGMLLYGGIGWLIGRWTGLTAVLFPVGMLVGLALALAMVIFRYGRS